MDHLLVRAREIAAEAHHGQRDQVGNPYLDHCEQVAELGDEEQTARRAFQLSNTIHLWRFADRPERPGEMKFQRIRVTNGNNFCPAPSQQRRRIFYIPLRPETSILRQCNGRPVLQRTQTWLPKQAARESSQASASYN